MTRYTGVAGVLDREIMRLKQTIEALGINPGDLASLLGRVTALESAVTSLGNRVTTLEGRSHITWCRPPLTNANWENATKTSANNGTIDLVSDFGVPSGVTGVLVLFMSKSDTASKNILLQQTSSGSTFQLAAVNLSANVWVYYTAPISAPVYIAYDPGATFNVYLRILGYWS